MATESLLRSLNAHDVRYVVIGATAFPRHSVASQIGSTPAWFASLDDLIRMKEAAGRPKDLEDLRALRLLREVRPPPCG